jgi:hypothetical protein
MRGNLLELSVQNAVIVLLLTLEQQIQLTQNQKLMGQEIKIKTTFGRKLSPIFERHHRK